MSISFDLFFVEQQIECNFEINMIKKKIYCWNYFRESTVENKSSNEIVLNDIKHELVSAKCLSTNSLFNLLRLYFHCDVSLVYYSLHMDLFDTSFSI